MDTKKQSMWHGQSNRQTVLTKTTKPQKTWEFPYDLIHRFSKRCFLKPLVWYNVANVQNVQAQEHTHLISLHTRDTTVTTPETSATRVLKPGLEERRWDLPSLGLTLAGLDVFQSGSLLMSADKLRERCCRPAGKQSQWDLPFQCRFNGNIRNGLCV